MPVYLVFVGLMLAMAVGTYGYNKILSFIEIGVSIAALAFVLIFTLNFRRYVKSIVSGALEDCYNVNKTSIEQIKLPVVVTGEYGEIVFYNARFKKAFFPDADMYNESVSEYLCDNDIAFCLKVDSVDIEFGGKKYTVYARKVSAGVMFLYIDNTYYKDTVDEYLRTRKSVAMIVFDNPEDFSSEEDPEGETSRITAERLLYRWAQKHNSLLRKLSDGKFVGVFDEEVLEKQIEKKFRILDRIRTVTVVSRPVTVSVGIGRGCKTLTESAAEAKKALDMAQGRGGDQVAVLKNGEYQFFGGVAKGVEKTSKVRVRVISESVRAAIESAECVLIMGHKSSDLDCIGSAAGLYAVVTKKFKKKCYIVTDKERSMARQMIDTLSKDDDEMFISEEHALIHTGEKTLCFIVDTHSPDFVESRRVYKSCGNVIIIDHHRKMVNFIDKASVFFHEPSASSCSELVTELVEYLGDEVLSRLEAEALLSGIMLDTKNFVVNVGARTFEAAAYLRKKGADTVAVRDVFANSLENYRNKSRLVASAQIYHHCAVAVQGEPIRNSRIVCAQAADDLLTIQDTYASFVISTIDLHSVNISARSFGKINVQLIMERLGGGGHQTMAATQLVGVSLEEAKEKLLRVLDEFVE